MAKAPTLKGEISRILEHTPAQRARGIIDSPYTRQILEQLPPQEAYLIIKEAWGMDSQILLQYLPAEAVCRFIDLDCWAGDSFSVESAVEWLQELHLASPEALIEALETLDMEVMVMILQACFEVVHVRPADEHMQDLMEEGFESLDNVYFYRVITDDEYVPFLREVMSILFTCRQDLYVTILESIMCELKSSLEESSYEKRSLRLLEMGFPSPAEAVDVYRHINRERLFEQGILKEKTPVLTKHLHMLPAKYLEQFSTGLSGLVKALSQAGGPTRDRFVYEMIYLANKLVMADYRPLNDNEGLRASMNKAGSLCSLGMDVAMREKGIGACAVLESMNAETLFSIGYNEISRLKHRLRLVLDSIERSMIPEHMREISDGLLKKRPQYKDREFSSTRELDEAASVVDALESMASLARLLGWGTSTARLEGTNTQAALDVETVVLTSAAVNTVSGQAVFRPLGREELHTFLSGATGIRGGRRTVKASFRRGLTAFLASLAPHLEGGPARLIADILCQRLEEETARIRDLSTLDARFITCLNVRL
jgi:hypothetical protein